MRQAIIWSNADLIHWRIYAALGGDEFFIFMCISVNEKFCIVVKISLQIVPEGPIDNNPALVQIMAWRRTCDKPLSEAMLTWFTDAYMRH